jgi:hypothetical protein
MDKQTNYDLFMVNVREMMYSDAGFDGIVSQIKSSEQGPVKGIAYTAAMIIKSIKGGFEQKKKKVSPEVLKTAFMETVADLVEISIASGIIEEGQKKQVATEALKQGADIYKKAAQIPTGPQGLIAKEAA